MLFLFFIDQEDEGHRLATVRAAGKHQRVRVEQTGPVVRGQGATGGIVLNTARLDQAGTRKKMEGGGGVATAQRR